MKKLVLFLIIFVCFDSLAKFRAREHYDYHQIDFQSETYTYRGLSNTINYFWSEKAMEHSFGLGVSTLGDNVENENLSGSPIGEKITLYQIDLEYKWFPKIALDGLYLRHGAGYSLLDTQNLDTFHGLHYQQAIGHEWFLKHFGLAFEFSAQSIFYESGVRSLTFGAAIGFHFYPYL